MRIGNLDRVHIVACCIVVPICRHWFTLENSEDDQEDREENNYADNAVDDADVCLLNGEAEAKQANW